MTEPLFDLTEDAEIVAALAEALAIDLPEACLPGVAANVRLLRRHIAVLRDEA
jgi:hypothetical protein